MQEEQLGISDKESEELRGMFVHTNPVLLYTTVRTPPHLACKPTRPQLPPPRLQAATLPPPPSGGCLRLPLALRLPGLQERPLLLEQRRHHGGPLLAHRPAQPGELSPPCCLTRGRKEGTLCTMYLY